ncbi:MAG: hypothetical protein II187_06315 [Treponema sp.]|jgi:hypothetical protein|nr:hypothetical protein [Treponema sp.]
MKETLIEEFVSKDSMQALDDLLAASEDGAVVRASVVLAGAFGAEAAFGAIADASADGEKKLISSFHNNLMLLIQKTWVEKSDEDLKAQVLYHLEEFTKQLESKAYAKAYPQFFSIVDDVVYLMFGMQTKTKEFGEYALRIDPEFGIFWWYMKSLPRDAAWSEGKTRISILLGMYFLANY